MFVRRKPVGHWPVTIFSRVPSNPGLEFLQHSDCVRVFILELLASNRVLPLELPQNQLAIGVQDHRLWLESRDTLATDHQRTVLSDVVGAVSREVHVPLVQDQPSFGVSDHVTHGHVFPWGTAPVHRDFEVAVQRTELFLRFFLFQLSSCQSALGRITLRDTRLG